VDDDRQPHAAGDGDGVVPAAVVHEEDFVHAARREVGDGRRERPGGVVRRQHGDDLVRAFRAVGGPEDAFDVELRVRRVERRGGQQGRGHRQAQGE
jgi:hypothetical protein